MSRRFKIGDVVKVERDERLYPSRGTWPKYRGRIGTVVTALQQGEVGVSWKPHAATYGAKMGADAWFHPHELTKLDPMVARALGAHPDDR
jgi:hypothetical protein